MKTQGNILGFDFGTKRIGVAVGQTITATATALQVVKAEKGVPDWKMLDKIIGEWQPVTLIVGLPLNMDGTTQHMTKLAKQFAIQLQERYALPVHTTNELLSTREARDHIFQQQGYRKLVAKPVDSIAAQIILTQWLEQQNQ